MIVKGKLYIGGIVPEEKAGTIFRLMHEWGAEHIEQSIVEDGQAAPKPLLEIKPSPRPKPQKQIGQRFDRATYANKPVASKVVLDFLQECGKDGASTRDIEKHLIAQGMSGTTFRNFAKTFVDKGILKRSGAGHYALNKRAALNHPTNYPLGGKPKQAPRGANRLAILNFAKAVFPKPISRKELRTKANEAKLNITSVDGAIFDLVKAKKVERLDTKGVIRYIPETQGA